ncbi:MAG TPA: DUF692 domain-containing protein [Methylocystis sp.]|nr:DUF692 domain-containing protein [Methylocystis sp.]
MRPEAPAPTLAGVGFKPEHFEAIAAGATVGFFEIHAENYMGDGGAPHRRLAWLRERYPLSIHGVGLSLGGAAPLDAEHLARLRRLVDRYEPFLFSEHLAWCAQDGAFFNDLLPIPYSVATLWRVAERIDAAQCALGRRMLIENPATYVAFAESEIAETEFLRELARRAGCGLLLDVTNVHVCATNHGFSAQDYIDAFPIEAVEEIHLAGFAEDRDDDGAPLLIDAHCAPVSREVWRLYRRALGRRGPVATLVEWDNDLPEWRELHAQAAEAELCACAAEVLA